jgi:hypothetical protein
MAERERRSWGQCPDATRVCEQPVKGYATQANHNAEISEQTQLIVEVGRAVAQFLKSGLVPRRRASDDCTDPQAGKLHAVIARSRSRLRGKSSLMKHRVEKVA